MLPILYQNPSLVLYSYPLFMGLGWGVAFQVFKAYTDSVLSLKYLYLLFAGIFLFAWLGAKIMFLITAPENMTQNLSLNLSFWMGGGFVFYGGFLAVLIYLIIFHKFISPLNVYTLWAMVVSLTFGHGIGRIGCLLAGCCFGEITNLPWGIYMHEHYRHPTQIIESMALIGFGFFLLKSKLPKGKLVISYLFFYGLLRIFIELLRGDTIRGQWLSLSPSLFLSIIFLILAILLRFIYRKS